jgi:hypothetical protein
MAPPWNQRWLDAHHRVLERWRGGELTLSEALSDLEALIDSEAQTQRETRAVHALRLVANRKERP